MEGTLVKKGKVIKNWKRRYFVLQDDKLTYYKNQEMVAKVPCFFCLHFCSFPHLFLEIQQSQKKPIKTITIRGAVITRAPPPLPEDVIPNAAFAIRTEKREFVFAANSKEDFRRWKANNFFSFSFPSLTHSLTFLAEFFSACHQKKLVEAGATWSKRKDVSSENPASSPPSSGYSPIQERAQKRVESQDADESQYGGVPVDTAKDTHTVIKNWAKSQTVVCDLSFSPFAITNHLSPSSSIICCPMSDRMRRSSTAEESKRRLKCHSDKTS
jgi:hypothetical protein